MVHDEGYDMHYVGDVMQKKAFPMTSNNCHVKLRSYAKHLVMLIYLGKADFQSMSMDSIMFLSTPSTLDVNRVKYRTNYHVGWNIFPACKELEDNLEKNIFDP